MSGPDAQGLAALAGLRVVELGVWVAAPAAGALLADWGVDVIKVEPPAGDPMRRAFGSLGIGGDVPNPAFAQDNRGKRSVVLDLRQHEARERLEELLETADVFLTNLRPDALDAPRPPAGGHGRTAPPPRLLQRERLRPAGRRPQPAGLRRRCFLGPLGAVRAAGDERRRHPPQRPRRHRRPHQRAGGAGRAAGRGARAAPERAGPRRGGVAAADRQLRARLGPEPPGQPGQGGAGRVPPREPDAVDELLPDAGWPVALLDRPRGRSPPPQHLPGPRSGGPPRRPPLRRRVGRPQEPYRGHRRHRRDHRPRAARRVGGAVRPRGRVVGAGPGPGRRPGRPAAGGDGRSAAAHRRGGREDGVVDQRPDQLLGPPRAAVHAGTAPGPAHRRGAGGPGRAAASAA